MPQYPQSYMPQMNMNMNTSSVGTLKGRPVTSIEEVRAAAVDFDGTVQFFPDLANGRIYTKQCNLDGTAALNMYEKKEIPLTSTPGTQDFVTRKEFEQTLENIKQLLMTKIPKEETPDEKTVSEFKF